MKTLLASLAMLTAAAATTTTPPAPIPYRFDEVKRTVVLKTASQESPATKGLHAQSGDRVHTGWFSYALIAAEPQRARFEIFGSTDVQLAGGTPGVILSLERGRIHAMFDKITGSEPRIVQTPGALLAVRGTQYNVEVDNSGKTMLDVFEGTVEIRSALRPEPFLIHAGESSIFSRRDLPLDHPMKTPDDRRQDPQGRHDGSTDPHGGHDGHDDHGRPSNDPGAGHGSQPPPQPPQARPPQPPNGPGGHH